MGGASAAWPSTSERALRIFCFCFFKIFLFLWHVLLFLVSLESAGDARYTYKVYQICDDEGGGTIDIRF